MDPARHITDRFLSAVASRDLRLVEDTLAPDAVWQNVPHEPAVGREAVMAMLRPIITWSDRVRWDVASAAYDGTTAWLERADRFWIDGVEHTVLCHGVFEVDPIAETVVSVRDYVDLGEWRARVSPALAAMAARSADEVITRHMAAVVDRDPVAMAADYTADAVLHRAGVRHQGWRAIADYFDSVPARLDGLGFSYQRSPADPMTVRWEITNSDNTVVASGSDIYVVDSGRIVEQTVELNTADF